MLGDIGFDKVLLLLVVFLFLFGARRIPEIGRSLGKGIREFKASLAGIDGPLESLTAADDAVREPQPVRRLGT